jgi:hypothetical protein
MFVQADVSGPFDARRCSVVSGSDGRGCPVRKDFGDLQSALRLGGSETTRTPGTDAWPNVPYQPQLPGVLAGGLVGSGGGNGHHFRGTVVKGPVLADSVPYSVVLADGRYHVYDLPGIYGQCPVGGGTVAIPEARRRHRARQRPQKERPSVSVFAREEGQEKWRLRPQLLPELGQ